MNIARRIVHALASPEAATSATAMLPRSDRRTALARIASASLAAGTAFHAVAQSAATKQLRIVVGSPPSALGDILTRLVGQSLGDAMGHSTIIDNRPGASGVLAADAVAKAPADGRTLLVALDSVFVINPSIFKKLPFDPARDFRSVALLCKASSVVVANPTLGIKTFAELLALAKSKPGTIAYGSAGIGHTTHIAMELLCDRLGVRMTHVPYKGSSFALQDLIGGQIGAMLLSIPEALAQIPSGKIVPLAATGPAAKEFFPKLPELKDAHADLDIAAWFAIFAPAATPATTVDALNASINAVLQKPEVGARMREFGLTPLPSPPSAVDTLVARDQARFGPLVKALGITAE